MVSTVAIVLGYGCHLDAVLRRYLDHAARAIRAAQPDAVVTTGGFTARRSAPGVSEAQLMADYLAAAGVVAPLLVEDAARTTLENFRNSARALRERGVAPERLLVTCDSVRVVKVRMLAEAFLPGVPAELCPCDFDRSAAQAWVQRHVAPRHDAALLRWPLLERLSLALVGVRQARS